MTKDEILSKFDRNGHITMKEAEFMYDNIIKLPDKGRALDVCTGMGDSSMLLALTKPNWTIYTIDGYGLYGSTGNIWNKQGENNYRPQGITTVLAKFKNYNVKNIISMVGNSWDVPWELPVDVLYIDADHSHKGVGNDVNHLSKFVKKGGFMGFHDYNNHYCVKEYIDQNLLDDWTLDKREGIALAILRRKSDN